MTKRKSLPDIESIGARMDALGLWKELVPYNFAIKPRGTVYPYFCTVIVGDGDAPVKARLLMLEGWQTMHDYVRTRIDCNFGFASSPLEFPHFELVVMKDSSVSVFRQDVGFMPQDVSGERREFVARLLWEAFGVFLRVDGDRSLPLKFAEDRAVFARVEGADGSWSDEPLKIPDPPPHRETVSFPKDVMKSAQDMSMDSGLVLEVDFRLLSSVMTKEPRPRTVYELAIANGKTGEALASRRVSLTPIAGLREVWEAMPAQVLSEIVRIGRVPGEICVKSGRVFRMLRPLCMELPFRLSLHDRLERL